ncbi:hypothetical protein TNCV_3861461 [Trichonephila clavipes]|nr:hypothetical protein TNCV_3861461 [Trichonephila clavipes]
MGEHNRSKHGSPHFSPTSLVHGDNSPARLIPTPTLYLVHHLEGYKSSCHIDVEDVSLSRQADIHLHSNRLRATCVRRTQHECCSPELPSYRTLKLKIVWMSEKETMWRHQSCFPNWLTCVML